jgi:hypothetical protein
VRGKVLSYRNADYTAAAIAAGASHWRVITTHMLPNAMSHIIVVASFAVPGAIAAETALSFLNLGMLPPAVSWGVLLQDAQQIKSVTLYPWLLIPPRRYRSCVTLPVPAGRRVARCGRSVCVSAWLCGIIAAGSFVGKNDTSRHSMQTLPFLRVATVLIALAILAAFVAPAAAARAPRSRRLRARGRSRDAVCGDDR